MGEGGDQVKYQVSEEVEGDRHHIMFRYCGLLGRNR